MPVRFASPNTEHLKLSMPNAYTQSEKSPFPRNLIPDAPDRVYSVHGGYGDVYKGTYNGTAVAVKVMRWHGTPRDIEKQKQHFSHEIPAWRQLSHPNVLPIFDLGDTFDVALTPAIISPWMKNGNVQDYIRCNPNTDRLKMILGIALGLEYLHSKNIVHGDLHTRNILINDHGIPVVADFGHSLMRIEAYGELDFATDGLCHIRHTAPELVAGETQHPSDKSDVYSFASVSFEILSGLHPFSNFGSSVDIILALYEGILPFDRPKEPLFSHSGLNQAIWELMTLCWNGVPDDRPSMTHSHNVLVKLQAGNSPGILARL